MPEILHEITVDAPARKVFDALTTEPGLKSWWTVNSESDPRPCGKATFGFYGGAVTFHLKFAEFEPGKRLKWNVEDAPGGWNGTDVSLDLSPGDEEGTKLRFRHGGWKTTEGEFAMVNTTWGHLMYSLKTYAESGKAAPVFTQ